MRRTAVRSSSGALSLVRYPDAPARRTRDAYWSAGCTLSTSTGTFGRSSRSCFKSPGPLLHAQEPERPYVGEGRLPEPDPVVPDLQHDVFSGPGQHDSDGLRMGVARNVGQGFLTDAEQRSPHVRPDLEAPTGRRDRAADAGALLELFRVPLHGGDEAQVVQDRGPELTGDPAHVVDRLVHDGAQGGDLRRLASRDVAEPLGEASELELQAGQRLAELVVDLPRDAGPLLLPDGLQVRRERLEVVVGVLELRGPFGHAPLEVFVHAPDLLLRDLAVGDVEGHDHPHRDAVLTRDRESVRQIDPAAGRYFGTCGPALERGTAERIETLPGLGGGK